MFQPRSTSSRWSASQRPSGEKSPVEALAPRRARRLAAGQRDRDRRQRRPPPPRRRSGGRRAPHGLQTRRSNVSWDSVALVRPAPVRLEGPTRTATRSPGGSSRGSWKSRGGPSSRAERPPASIHARKCSREIGSRGVDESAVARESDVRAAVAGVVVTPFEHQLGRRRSAAAPGRSGRHTGVRLPEDEVGVSQQPRVSPPEAGGGARGSQRQHLDPGVVEQAALAVDREDHGLSAGRICASGASVSPVGIGARQHSSRRPRRRPGQPGVWEGVRMIEPSSPQLAPRGLMPAPRG